MSSTDPDAYYVKPGAVGFYWIYDRRLGSIYLMLHRNDRRRDPLWDGYLSGWNWTLFKGE